MTGKKDKIFLFETELNWIEKKKGLLSTTEVTETIHVATPATFGGEGKYWTPEHLFLASMSSCFMSTFLAFAEKMDVPVSNFACPAIGQVSMQEGKYKFLTVDIYPRVIIPYESLRDKAIKALEKTHKYCIISNSVNATVIYHSEVLTLEQPVELSEL